MSTENLHAHLAATDEPMLIAWFDDFDGDHEYRCLSNFYMGDPLFIPEVDPYHFLTGEHAFAAMKCRSHEDFKMIQEASTPGEAKHLGRGVNLRPDWEAVKYDAMMAVLRAKFTLDRAEGETLLETHDALLIEGTFWDDTVWGVALRDENTDPEAAMRAMGRNWLGTMLMARRAELKAEFHFGLAPNTGAFNAYFARRGQW